MNASFELKRILEQVKEAKNEQLTELKRIEEFDTIFNNHSKDKAICNAKIESFEKVEVWLKKALWEVQLSGKEL